MNPLFSPKFGLLTIFQLYQLCALWIDFIQYCSSSWTALIHRIPNPFKDYFTFFFFNQTHSSHICLLIWRVNQRYFLRLICHLIARWERDVLITVFIHNYTKNSYLKFYLNSSNTVETSGLQPWMYESLVFRVRTCKSGRFLSSITQEFYITVYRGALGSQHFLENALQGWRKVTHDNLEKPYANHWGMAFRQRRSSTCYASPHDLTLH